MIMHKLIIILLVILCQSVYITGQQRVGVNTTTPVRTLEIYGSGTQYLRVHSSTPSGVRVGLELIRGDDNEGARDWRVNNWNNKLRIDTGTDNFATSGDEVLQIN